MVAVSEGYETETKEDNVAVKSTRIMWCGHEVQLQRFVTSQYRICDSLIVLRARHS